VVKIEIENKLFKKIYCLIIENSLFIIIYSLLNKKKIFGLRDFIKKNRLTPKKKIIFYAYHPINFQNVKGLINILSQNKQNQITLICYFSEDKIKIENKNSNIDIIFNASHLILKFFTSDLYITSMSSQNVCFPKHAKRIHFFHSLIGIEVYPNDAFDSYDYIFCTGKHHIKELKQLIELRKLKSKCLIPGGYPKLDEQLCNLKKNAKKSTTRTFIYAPTLYYKSNNLHCKLLEFGDTIISIILELNHQIIFRPHPLNRELDFVKKLVNKFKNNSNFSYDISDNYFETYNLSDVMITDFSGTAFTYSFGFEKPILFIMDQKLLENSLGSEKIQHLALNKIGIAAYNEEGIKNNIEEINYNYEKYTENVISFRDEMIFNIGNSDEYFSKNLDFILNSKENKNWYYF
jgi:YidC/Oxa1 family membrane protein insertase